MQTIALSEILNLHNAVLNAEQVEELACNKHISEIDYIGKRRFNCIAFLFTLVNGQKIRVFEKIIRKEVIT